MIKTVKRVKKLQIIHQKNKKFPYNKNFNKNNKNKNKNRNIKNKKMMKKLEN